MTTSEVSIKDEFLNVERSPIHLSYKDEKEILVSEPVKGRLVAIRHRIKRTAEGEAKPTQVYILGTDGKTQMLTLEDDDAELRFALGCLEIKKKKICGLEPDDVVLMTLGGSGDNLAYALTKRGEDIGASVWRLPPYRLKEARDNDENGSRDFDPERLVRLYQENPMWFYQVRSRDRALIIVRELQRARMDAMKNRISCGQVLRHASIGRVFTAEDGLYPEGGIEQSFELAKTNDPSYQALVAFEQNCNKQLERALKALDVWTVLFEPIRGCGPAIGARLIAEIQDIRRFETDAQLKAFCGVHVLEDGIFARRRVGQKCNWNPDARQALYLLADQFNRAPGSFWGQKLIQNKARLRAIHPEVVEWPGKDGKTVKLYAAGHIHKMAIWRTLSQFVRWLHRAWWTLERTGTYSLPSAA